MTVGLKASPQIQQAAGRYLRLWCVRKKKNRYILVLSNTGAVREHPSASRRSSNIIRRCCAIASVPPSCRACTYTVHARTRVHREDDTVGTSPGITGSKTVASSSTMRCSAPTDRARRPCGRDAASTFVGHFTDVASRATRRGCRDGSSSLRGEQNRPTILSRWARRKRDDGDNNTLCQAIRC